MDLTLGAARLPHIGFSLSAHGRAWKKTICERSALEMEGGKA
jgi:hypothetical protein